MKKHNNKFSLAFYYILWSALLIQLNFLSSVQAQNSEQRLIAEDKDPAVLQVVPASKDLLSNSQDADFLYEELYLSPLLDKADKPYVPTKIEREHYIDNPFDIDDFSNPFNLPRPGSRKRLVSTKKSSQQKASNFFKDLFAYKTEKQPTLDPSKVEIVTPSWLFFLCIALLGFFTYLLTIYREEVRKNFNSFFSISSTQQKLREQQNPFSPYSVASYLLFALGTGAFCLLAINMLTSDQSNPPNWSISFYLVLSAGVAMSYFLKYGQLSILSMIFPIKQELQYYNYMLNNSNRLLAMSIVPLLFLVAYTPEGMQNIFLYSSLFIITSLYSFAAIRTILAARETILFHKFHFFIYLCSVEIAPALILMKLISII